MGETDSLAEVLKIILQQGDMDDPEASNWDQQAQKCKGTGTPLKLAIGVNRHRSEGGVTDSVTLKSQLRFHATDTQRDRQTDRQTGQQP